MNKLLTREEWLQELGKSIERASQTAAPVAQGELGTLCFHIEQAIKNGCCPPDIEDAYEAYAKATAA